MEYLSLVGIFFILLVGLDLVVGYCGLLNLGYNGFFALGGFTAAILTTKYGLSSLIVLLICVSLCAIMGFALSVLFIKLSGFYYCIATIAFAMVIYEALLTFSDITGGLTGIGGIPAISLGALRIGSDFRYAIFIWFIAIGIFWLCLNITHSRIGRALLAIRTDQTAAAAIGIPVNRYKIKCFLIGSSCAGVGGFLYAHFRGVVIPQNFDFDVMLDMMLMLYLGGAQTVWGAFLGVILLKILPEILLFFKIYRMVIYALVFIFILFYLPGGMAGFINLLLKRLKFFNNDKKYLTVNPIRLELLHGSLHEKNTKNVAMLQVIELEKSFGGLVAVKDLSFKVNRGQIKAIIGPNGAGKTTVFNLISNIIPPDRGETKFKGETIRRLKSHQIASIGIGRTFQIPCTFPRLNVIENVMVGCHSKTKQEVFSVSVPLSSAKKEECLIHQKATSCLSFVGLSEKANSTVASLSYGHKKLLEIARTLASEPEVLLLDEPTAGLNDTEKKQLLELILRLSKQGMTVLVVEHDMNFVMSISEEIVVMNFGQKIAEGSPVEIQKNSKVIDAYLGEKD